MVCADILPALFTEPEPAEDPDTIIGYFVCIGPPPRPGYRTPKYDLMYGEVENATGILMASDRTIKALLRKAPKGEPVWRVYLQRTDGRTGSKLP